MKTNAKKRAKVGSKAGRKKVQHFRLLDLPPELRDAIYDAALLDGDGVSLVAVNKGYCATVRRGRVPFDRRRPTPSEDVTPYVPGPLRPKLLAVSKQIHDEAIGILYGQPFAFQNTVALHSFLGMIGQANMKRLLHLTVQGWSCGRGIGKAANHAGLTLLQGAVNLKSLTLDCHLDDASNPKSHARFFFRQSHHFLQHYGFAKGRKDAAFDILNINECNFKGPWYAPQAHPGPKEWAETFMAEVKRLMGI